MLEEPDNPASPVDSAIPVRTEALALGLILLLGAALRFYGLGFAPPGLWMDEALKARDATTTAAGNWQLIYPDVFPREPLFIWIQALGVLAFGSHIVTMRAISGVIGVVTILALYLCVRRWSGQRAALLAAGLLAGLRWHVIFSRLLFRTLLLPLWIILIVHAAAALRERGGVWRAALLGVLVGGGYYTYLSWHFMVPGVVALAAWAVWSAPNAVGGVRGRIRLALAAAIPAALVFAPLGVHYLHHPDHLTGRAGAVSIFSADDPWREIVKNFCDALLMFNWKGDHVPKQNIPWAAALNPAVGLCFLGGVGLCLWRGRRRTVVHLMLLGWLSLGMAPTIFTKTDSPNFLRTLVLTPAVCWIAALGLEAFASFAGRCVRGGGARLEPGVPRGWIGIAINSVLCAIIALSAVLTFQQVFFRWARAEDVWQSFNGSFTQLGESAARTPAGTTFWVPQYLGEHLTFQFLSGESLPQPYRREAADRVRSYASLDFLRELPGEPPGARRIVATGHNGVYPILLRFAAGGRVIEEFRSPEGAVWAILYEIPPGALPKAEDLDKAGQAVAADLRW